MTSATVSETPEGQWAVADLPPPLAPPAMVLERGRRPDETPGLAVTAHDRPSSRMSR